MSCQRLAAATHCNEVLRLRAVKLLPRPALDGPRRTPGKDPWGWVGKTSKNRYLSSTTMKEYTDQTSKPALARVGVDTRVQMKATDM